MDIGALMKNVGFDFSTLFSTANLGHLLSAAVTIALVLLAFAVLQFMLRRLLKGRATDQTMMLARKALRYASFVVVILIFFDRLGLDLTGLLGAAGIAGIAIGFAAQTSVSNVISGLFLVSEKPFAIGDVITVGDITGTVISIDLLSIKIQTFDNRFVRIPNETIIKSNVVNVTRYPIRRMDINVTVSYEDDLDRAVEVLTATARDNFFVLDNPETMVLIDRFDEKGVVVLLGLWFLQSDFLELKNSIMLDLRKAFRANGLGLPTARVIVSQQDRPTKGAGAAKGS
jgi:small-conductance mechanosensitive channel